MDIASKLHAFHMMHMEAEPEQATYDDCNVILKGLQWEMEIILVADVSEHGWGLVWEMHNQPATVDPQLQEQLTRAESALKCKQKESRGGQVVGASQQQSIQISKDTQPTTYTTIYPRYQESRFHCFNCSQDGHYQKACPLAPQSRRTPVPSEALKPIESSKQKFSYFDDGTSWGEGILCFLV